MNIEFKNFNYKILPPYQESPKVVQVDELIPGREHLRYEFKFDDDNIGFHIITTSQIFVPLNNSGRFIMYKSSMNFLIPYEQHIDTMADNLKLIDKSVRAEFLFFHLCRQSSIIYVDTYIRNGNKDGYNIDVPTLYRLYQQDLSE